jgi:hypothetical protein
MHRWINLACLLCMLFLVGCQGPGGSESKKYEPMGDKAPVFGSTPEMKTVQKFVEGTWLRTSFSPSGGLFSGDLTGQDSADRYTFATDGTLRVKLGKHLIGGTYTVSGNNITLAYTSVNGNPIEQLRAEVRAAEEKGTQGGVLDAMILEQIDKRLDGLNSLSLAADGRMLRFPPDYETDEQTGQQVDVGGPALERAEEVKP